MKKNPNVLILILLLLYWISPMDLIPGSLLDDIIITICYFIYNRESTRIEG